MKPKSRKSFKPKKESSKPSVSAAAIRKTLKNVVEKDLLTEVAGGKTKLRSDERAISTRGKTVSKKYESQPRVRKNRLQLSSNNHKAQGKSRKPVGGETSKHQKLSLLEIPKLPTRQGALFVVGQNDVGQLGLTDTGRPRKRPTELPLGVPVVDIAAGAMHSACLTADGKVYTFGCNDEGALGRAQSNDDNEILPAVVDLPENVVMISAGDSHTAALCETGKVYLWGNFRNLSGSMGLTPAGDKSTVPMRILENVVIVKIASGFEHLVCLSASGVVYTCGCAEYGRLGRITPRSAPNGGRTGGLAALLTPDVFRPAGKIRRFNNIWAGAFSTFASECQTNKIYASGLNNFNQLGYARRNSENAIYFPEWISRFARNTHLICGDEHHTLSVDVLGHVYAVGRRDYGRLGLNENPTEDALEPTLIPSLQDENCCDASCGNCASFAVNTQGVVFSWGMGDSYKLGHGNEEDCFLPTAITGHLADHHAFRVSGGGQHTLILVDN